MEEATKPGGVGSWLSGYATLNFIITFLATLLIVWMLFKLSSVVRALAGMLREIFLFWTIALSSSKRNLKKPLRLHPYLCQTSYLDEVGVNELYQFFMEDFRAARGMTAEDIHKWLLSYTHILMCRDRVDGTLRGAMLIGIERKGEYTLLKTGLTTFKNYYRGSPFIKLILLCLATGELLKHPLTPVYVVGKVASYKAYLVGLSMNKYHPVYNKETPELYKKIFADFADSVVRSFGGRAKYNPETFVLEQEDVYLEENLQTVSEQDLQNPHIKFYVEKNPGWKKGHCVVVGFRVTWLDFFLTAKHVVRRAFGRRREHPEPTKAQAKEDKERQDSQKDKESTSGTPTVKKKLPHPKLLRRYTFQEMRANTYAVNNIEYDVTGEAVLSPTSKAAFAFQTAREDSELNSPGPTEFNIDLPSLS